MARGKEIASHPEMIEKIGADEWSVPSQAGFGRRSVRRRPSAGVRAPTSTPVPVTRPLLRVSTSTLSWPFDFTRRTSPLRPRNGSPEGSTPSTPPTPRLRLRRCASSTRSSATWSPTCPICRRSGARVDGRPLPLSDALYCSILKVYSGLAGRRACGVYENVSDRGLLGKVPSYNVASRALNRPEATAGPYRLLRLSAAPLTGLEEGGAIAPDSTGVQTTSFGGWREEKHGEKREKKWLKVHAVVGTRNRRRDRRPDP